MKVLGVKGGQQCSVQLCLPLFGAYDHQTVFPSIRSVPVVPAGNCVVVIQKTRKNGRNTGNISTGQPGLSARSSIIGQCSQGSRQAVTGSARSGLTDFERTDPMTSAPELSGGIFSFIYITKPGGYLCCQLNHFLYYSV